MEAAASTMEYRKLGATGLKVSVLSFGNMINYKPENADIDDAIIQKCIDAGINYFDTAEIYADGTEWSMQASVKKHSGGLLPRARSTDKISSSLQRYSLVARQTLISSLTLIAST